MRYRIHRGQRISEIGVGCYSLAGVYGAKNREEFKKMLRRAHEVGVTFFDTAEGYGDAEKILGEAIKPYREEVFIATKVGIRGDARPNLSKSYIQVACKQSLERLQTDYIDLYQIHFDDPHTPVEETIDALESLITEGVIRFYGVGHLPADRVEEYCRTGTVFSLLVELSAVARSSRERLLPLCRKHGAAGIAFSTTGRGLLTGKYKSPNFEPGDLRNIDPLFQRENFQSNLRIVNKFAKLARDYERTPVQMALAWVLSQPGMVCALTGPSTISHLEENIGGSGWSLSSEHLKELEDLFKREDQWLEKEHLLSLKQILSHELPHKSSRAFTDLIYAMETIMLLELAEEKDVSPLLYELFALRKNPDAATLKSIQERLNTIIDIENLNLEHRVH